jgi:uncharacterized protein YndB with AHSA1/START domain
MTEASTFQLHMFIRTSPETLWNALTDGAITQHWYTLNSRVESTWAVGAPYQYVGPGEMVLIHGEVEAAQPNTRLAMSFNPDFLPEPVRGATSRVVYDLAPAGDTVRLTLTHEGLDPHNPTTPTITIGWAAVISSLKSYLETGSALNIPVN